MKGLHLVTFTLLVVGGLNWLLEAFGWGVGNWLPENVSLIVYVLVGLSAIVEIALHGKSCKMCKVDDKPMMNQGQM